MQFASNATCWSHSESGRRRQLDRIELQRSRPVDRFTDAPFVGFLVGSFMSTALWAAIGSLLWSALR